MRWIEKSIYKSLSDGKINSKPKLHFFDSDISTNAVTIPHTGNSFPSYTDLSIFISIFAFEIIIIFKMASSREHASLHSHLRPHLHVESVSKFDQYRIVEHYVRLRESQQEKLANINLSEELKRKLFGFSEGFYLTNHHDPYKLVIENHPLKGRTIMTEDRYHF